MKPPTEMMEGPEATQRFEDTMKLLFCKRKANVLSFKEKATTKTKAGKPS